MNMENNMVLGATGGEPRLSQANIRQLQVLLGGISEDDCKMLVEEYGEEDMDEAGLLGAIVESVYEVMESSKFDNVTDLIWHIKQNPCFGGARRSNSLRERNPNGSESWCLARSKSSNTINKHSSNLTLPTQQRPASATAQIDSNCEVTQAVPYSGTRNPIQIVKTQKGFDAGALRLYMSTYLQQTESRNLLYDIFEKRSPKLLILLRGASGSGKSTLATIIWAISESGEVCSADHYFTNRNGQYNFNRASLGEAHETCKTKCRFALQRGESPIVIDNTNTRVDEMYPYVTMAVEYNYDIKIVEPMTDWKNKAYLLAQKNIHGVPKRNIQDQLERFESTTVKAMVDKVLKQRGLPAGTYRPVQDLEWTAPDVILPLPRPAAFAQPTFLPTLPRTHIPTSTLISPGPSSPKVTTVQTNQIQTVQSWIETPIVSGASTIMLSDLVPDLKNGGSNSTPKPKRSAKRSGNGNATTTTASASTPRSTPLEFEDPAHVAFSKLCRHFPTAAKDELEAIFNLYEGDLDACASALIETGLELVAISEHENEFEVKPTENPPVPLPSDTWGGQGQWDLGLGAVSDVRIPSTSVNQQYEKPLCSIATDDANLVPFDLHFDDESDACDSSNTDEDSEFEMVIPEEFARALLGAFGHPDDEARDLSLEERTVKLGADVAFEVYKKLYLNMHIAEVENARNSGSGSDDSSRANTPVRDDGYQDEFDAIAISLTQMELETTSGNPQLANIIDIESKINYHTQESLKSYTAPNRTMAQNLNFSELKQLYPSLDAAVIDEVYCQCHLNMEKTKMALHELYLKLPKSSSPQHNSNGNMQSDSSWHLKYNPKDVQLYSNDEIKNMQKTYDQLEKVWFAEMVKIKDYYGKCKNTGSQQVKSYYITEAKKISEKMSTLADEMQYYRAITQNAKHKNDHILDLHGLKVNGAMKVLKQFLHYKEDEFMNCGIPKMILLIITGVGKHSKNGCPVLLPAVKNFLNQRHYKFHSANPGSYTVILTKGSVHRRQ